MSGTQKVQDPGDHARKYGAFQSEIYAAGMSRLVSSRLSLSEQ